MRLLPKYESGILRTEDGGEVEYVDVKSKGRGTPLVFIPGAGDGLGTVRGSALSLAFMYRQYARERRVIFVSRRQPLPAEFTVRDLARDFVFAADELGVAQFHLQASSGGGPIAQWLAIDEPERVKSLVLGETFAHVDEHLRNILLSWIGWSEAGEWYSLLRDTVVKTYTPSYVRKIRWALPLLRFMATPKDPNRMARLLRQLLPVDNRVRLSEIVCPTLVIGGDEDAIVPFALEEEMAARIPDARLVAIRNYGHGALMEARREYSEHVLRFHREVEEGGVA